MDVDGSSLEGRLHEDEAGRRGSLGLEAGEDAGPPLCRRAYAAAPVERSWRAFS